MQESEATKVREGSRDRATKVRAKAGCRRKQARHAAVDGLRRLSWQSPGLPDRSDAEGDGRSG